ncbi:hypothetical protein P3L10_019165 [Capsicum annuum]
MSVAVYETVETIWYFSALPLKKCHRDNKSKQFHIWIDQLLPTQAMIIETSLTKEEMKSAIQSCAHKVE